MVCGDCNDQGRRACRCSGDPSGARLARTGCNMREAGRKPRVAPWAPIGRGFSLLLAIAMTDSAARMGFLTFLPFLLKIKGADLPTRIALTLIFAGGAASKLASGWLAAARGT